MLEHVPRLDKYAGEESKVRVEEVFPYEVPPGDVVVPLGAGKRVRSEPGSEEEGEAPLVDDLIMELELDY